MLPGDLIQRLASRTRLVVGLGPERERGSLDPQTLAEFLEYDIDFEVEPATAFEFPSEVDRG